VTAKETPASTPHPTDPDESRVADEVPAADWPDDEPAQQDLQAVRISKALETAAARKISSTPLFGPAPISDELDAGGTVEGASPAPISADTLSGRNAAAAKRPKRRSSSRLLLAKFGLPAVILLTLGYLSYWWYIHNREAVINVATPDQPATTTPMVTVNNFKYSSTDNQNRPYTIIADSAAQPQDKTLDTVTLVRPQANFTLADNHWMTITAKNGLYHRNADTIDLDGDVTLDHDTGLTFHTSRAQIDMKAKVAAGSEPVQGQNATSDINSEGFRILDDGNVIIFTGKTLLKLHDREKDGNE
jgi:lipopolysaccharide export system protein LptC